LRRLRLAHDAPHASARRDREHTVRPQRAHDGGLEAILTPRGLRGEGILEAQVDLRPLADAHLARIAARGALDVLPQVGDRAAEVLDLAEGDAGALAACALLAAHLDLEIDGLLADLVGAALELLGLGARRLEGP